MGIKLKVVLCDEHGFGGSGEYFGDNDAHLDITNAFYHEALGGSTYHARCSSNSSPA